MNEDARTKARGGGERDRPVIECHQRAEKWRRKQPNVSASS